jgi:putative endonuclease
LFRPCVYILTNRAGGVLYIGVTRDLERRLAEHRDGRGSRFAAKYNLHRLVWFRQFAMMADAIKEEKRLKAWKRQWKLDLIEATNPNWQNRTPPNAPATKTSPSSS